MQQLDAEGRARVIVHLALDFYPEGTLSGMQLAQQRTRISQTQAALMDRLVSQRVMVNHQFTFVPALALTVDAEALSVLRAAPEVASLEVDRLNRPSLDVSTPLIGAPQAWASGYTGAGWAVAVLDTGVDKTHAFLSNKVVSEACYSTTYPQDQASSVCPGGGQAETGPGTGGNCSMTVAGCDHGTHVAGIAAGYQSDSFAGVAKEASVIAIQVFSRIDDAEYCKPGDAPCVTAYTSDIVRGLERVLALHNDSSFTTSIASVNLSLGGGQYNSPCDAQQSVTKAAIDNLRSVGIATVVASGNDGFTSSMSSPACISTAISVGATSDDDTVGSFSNSASFLDLLAPGVTINSSVPGGGFESWPGTSMATPHVAGAWAVLKSTGVEATTEAILTALKNTGVSVTDTRNGITKPRIQIDAAADYLVGAGVPDIQVSPTSLTSKQAPDTRITTTLAIQNQGSGNLTWDTTKGTAGGTQELVVDGGFEGGEPNADWTVSDSSPLCSEATCGYNLARTGDWFAWFGGGVTNEYSLEQSITFPADVQATLSFWLELAVVNSFSGGWCTVRLDEEVIASFNQDDADTYGGEYHQVEIDVSEYTDGAEHTLRFEGQQTSVLANFSVLVDDVSLIGESTEGGCRAISAINWLSMTPTQGSIDASATTHVDVVFDATGLVSGMYTDTLCLHSNDADEALVKVPVSLEVVAVVNHPPTDLALSKTSIYELQPAGTVVGKFSTVDADLDDIHAYTLVSGTGDTHNAAFVIEGNVLKSAEVFTYAEQSSYSIRVRTDDGREGTLERPFTIDVLEGASDGDLRISPPALTFSTTVGVTDPDPQSLALAMSGPATQTWSASVVPIGTWLSINPVLGQGSGKVNVTVNSAGLAADQYDGTITFHTDQSAVTTTVTLLLNPEPTRRIYLPLVLCNYP